MQRHNVLTGLLTTTLEALVSRGGEGHVPKVYDWQPGPPMNSVQNFIATMEQQRADARITVMRSGIYQGSIIDFVPFTKLVDGKIKRTHSG